MANTRTVQVSETAFTLLTTALSGFITNRTGDVVYYRTATSLPAPGNDDCHILENGESVPFSFLTSQNVYAIASGDGGKIVITED